MSSTPHYKKFLEETKVNEIVEEIEKELIRRHGKRPVYSDLIKTEDGKTYEYVNYVQEGGGVLGVGLVGYTYVLEKMGFRFLKLAGTSAGAINTMLLASVDKNNYKDEPFQFKSEIILHEMLRYNLWNLVDGHWFAKWLIGVFINKTIGLKVLRWLILFSVVVPVLFAIFTSILYLYPSVFEYNAIPTILKVAQGLTFTATALLIIEIILFLYFRYRFAKAGYGINPGDKFHEWITSILKHNKIETAADLEEMMKTKCCDLSLRGERLQQNITGDDTTIKSPYLTIVASDITTQTKVEFPMMAKDYWQDPLSVNPADFVRASMAIPIFFEPLKIPVPQNVQGRSSLQQQKASAADIENKAVKKVSFVDGGILSNFPINVFHDPSIQFARMPTFGVKLEDSKHIKPGKENKSKPTLFSFISRVFSTVRFYYDRDFLKRNAVYEMCIGHVDVSEANWLNFGIKYEEQKKLFIKGAEAARAFFLGGKVWSGGKEINLKHLIGSHLKTAVEKLFPERLNKKQPLETGGLPKTNC